MRTNRHALGSMILPSPKKQDVSERFVFTIRLRHRREDLNGRGPRSLSPDCDKEQAGIGREKTCSGPLHRGDSCQLFVAIGSLPIKYRFGILVPAGVNSLSGLIVTS